MSEYVSPIIVPIEGQLSEQSISTVAQRFEELQKDMPQLNLLSESLPEIVQPIFQALISEIESQKGNITKAMSSIIDGKAIGTEVNKALLESVGFFGANMKTAMSAGGALGRVMEAVPETMRQSFNAELSDMMRTASSVLHGFAYSSGTGAKSDASLQNYLQKHTTFSQAYNAFAKQYGLSEAMQRELSSAIVKLAVPAFNRADYIAQARQNAFGQLQKITQVPQFTSWKDRLPERFQNIPDVPQLQSRKQIKANPNLKGSLSASDYEVVRRVAAENPTFERALTMAGVATRRVHDGKASQLIMPTKPISKEEYAIALGYMDKDLFRPGLEGAPMYRRSLIDADRYNQQALANKTSRVPTEGFSAFDALKGIGVDPVYTRAPQRIRYNYSPEQSSSLRSAVSVRPDMYQVQSLTWDDFRKGVMLGNDAPKQSIYDERPAGTSVNKMISRSVFTDLLGMHGHNTYGNGSTTDRGVPLMLQLDLSKMQFATKPDGSLEYGKDGLPVQNAETKKLVEDLFSPRASITSAKSGEYRYPVVPYGEHGNYVPTNIKNGVIWMAEENAYRAASQRFIDKYGVNAFDNLIAQDQEFDAAKTLNKSIEARNRDLTPSVPFAEIGGRMPAASKIGFTDLKGVMGLDGGGWIMPGYIPGEAGTIRSVGIKGSMMSVDYKKVYRDLYGEDAEWFLPFTNAPESIKKMFKEQGIDAVRAAYNNPETRAAMGLGNNPSAFYQHFFDAMKMDAIIDKSEIKTDFYDKMNLPEMQEAVTDIANMTGGWRMVATARDFLTKSGALSKQVSQNLDLTPEELNANREKWDQYIFDLRNSPQKAVQRLFADQTVPLNKMLNENPGLLWEIPEAKSKVLEAIQSAEINRQHNKIFAEDDLLNALALPNIGEIAMKTSTGKTVQNKELARILGLGMDSKQDHDIVALAAWAGMPTNVFSGLRFPNNVTEQYALSNSQKYIDLLDEYGMSKDALYLNMKTIQKMGGGDVDGDTVTLARNQLHNIMVRTQKNRTAMIGEGYTPNISLTGVEDFDKRQANAGDFADLLYRQAAATFRMAAISNAADALAQGDWTDPGWVKLAGKGGIDLKAMYDIDSTFMKTGVASNWTAFAQNAKDLGKPFASVFKDLMGAVNENDYSMMADFSKVNFPSIYNGLTVSALEAIRNNPLSVQAVEKMIAAQEALQGIGDLEKSGRQADAAKAAYLRKNNELFTGLLTRGAIPSTKDLESLDEYLGLWRTELQTGKDFATTKEEKEYYDKQLREHSFQVNRMKHEGLFGIDERKRAEGLGYAGTGMLKNNPLSDQTTFFAQAYSDAEDQARMQRAIVEGANDHILSGVYKAAENQEERARIASAQAKADNLKYSWSMLHMLESGDPDKLQQWYKARINGERYNINTPEIAMGNAMSTLLQEYAAYATEHNQERGTSEMWEKRLDEILQTQHGNFFSELPTKDNNSKHTGKVLSTYERMHGFARALPGMFPEEDIVGAEIRVEPRMGNKVLVPGSPVKSEGFIDLQTRRRDTGELINTEMKPILGYPNIDDQVNLYNPERNAAYRRHLAYAETNDYTNPENYMRTMPYREEDMQAVERRMQNLTGLVQAWAGTGFQPDLMYRLFTPFAVNGKGQFVNGQPNVEDIAQGIAAAQAVSDMYADARKTGFTIKNDSEKKFVEDENGDLVPVFDRNKTFQEERGVIDQQTGKGIAKAMSLESDVRDYENSMEEMANKLFSKAYKAEKTNKGQTGKGNFWDAYERQLSENYLEKRQEFESRGASKQDLARLDAANMRAIDMYEKALRESASADFTTFSQNIDEKIQAHGTTGAARGYAKEFDSLTESIDAASQAYQKFVKDMSSNLQEGDVLAVENLQKLIDEGKITEEDAAAFRKAEKARTEADQKSAQYRQILRNDANLDMQQRLDAFTQQATGRPLSAEQRVDRQTLKFTNDLAKYSRDIDLLEKKGVLSATDAAKYRQGIAAFSAADYRQVLMDNENNMAALREQANDHQIDQLLRQGDMLRRNRYGSRRGIIARGLNQRDQAITQQQNYKDKIDQRLLSERQKLSGMKEGTDEYAKTAAHIKELEQASQGAGQAIEQLSNPMSTVSAITAQFGDVVGRLATRLGRQLFRKALNEAKKFVQEFDKSMTTIQMITLKSDSQMSTLGDGLIAKAKELKISISEITQSAETLYRQGLSDEEVDERLDIISKFSKVSGTKVDAATKLITVAMNTGLVSDPQVAADIVTALGDNAATNAAEIEKGIEKAGAAAAADGTTFAQLASMLTAITSTTQIGGNVAGRTLNTIFGRMNKIGTNELIYDENGNAVSGSAVAKLLAAQGINTYDEFGNKRSSYDVLYDLSQKWEKISDAEQQQLASAIAGTRQYSNFAAIMTGMSEGKVSEYMSLAGGAEGIVDEKYEIYAKSLQASLTDLKNAYDELVHDLTSSGALTGIVDFITNMITGIDNLTNSMGGLGAILTTVMPMLLGLAMLKTGMASGNLGLMAVGLGATALGGIIASTNGDQKVETAEERYTRSVETQNRNYSNYVSDIERAKQLKELGSNRTVAETAEFKTLLTKLAEVSGISFDDLTGATKDAAAGVESLATSAKGLGDAAKGAIPNVDDYADYIINGAEKDADNKKAVAFYENAAGLGTVVAEAATTADTDYYRGVGIQRLPIFTQNADGTYSVVDNAHERITGNYSDFGSMKAFITSGGSSDMPNRKSSIGAVFGEALRAPDYKYNVPSQYVNRDDQYWIDYFNNGPFSGPEDLPDEVLEAVAGYWSSPNRIKTRSEVVRNAAISKIAETLGGEEYAFIPEEYRTKLPELLVDSLPDTQWNTKDLTPTAIKYALLSAAGITDETDLSTLGTKDIVANIRDYIGNNGSVTQSQGSQYALEEVGSSGYYIDLNKQPGEEGYYISKEEAARRTEAYNKSLEPVVSTSTVSKRVGEVKVGDTTIAAFDSSDIASMNEAGEAYKNALAKVQNIKDTIEAIKGTLFFENMDREGKEAYVMDLIKTGLKQIGIEDYNGELAEFLVKDAQEIVSSTFETIEEEITTSETNPLEKPNLQAVQGYALGGRTTSYNKWSQDEKTAYKLTADRVYRIMQESGATDIDTWLNYVNNNGIRDFETLYQNGEFGKLMQQVYKNSETGKYEGPADIMSQLMNYMLSNGSEGTAFVSNKQKADYAKSMYDTLVSGETAFLSTEAAEQKEKEERAKYEADIQRKVEEARAKYGEQFTEEDYKNFEKGIREKTPYTGFVAEGARVYTPDEKKYLQEIVGEELYDRLTGKSGVQATADEQAYAAQLIANKRTGLTALTSRQQYNWLTTNKSRFSTLGKEGGLSRTVADAYMSQWSGWPEYAALLEKKNAGQTLSPEEQQQFNDLTQSLENFEQQSKIKIDIEGVQALEEAGKVADGTAAKLEKLQKGGDIAIKVSYEIQSEAYQTSQLGARLNNGTRAEQLEAIKSLTGYSDAQIQKMGFSAALTDAQTLFNSQSNLQAASLEEYYKAATTDEERALIDRIAHNAGFVNQYDDRGFMLNGRYRLNVFGNVDRVGIFAGAEQKYSDAQLAAAREQLLNGKLTQADNPELFAAAEQSLGAYGQQYQWYVENSEAEISDTQKERLRQQALYESSEILRQQNQTQRSSAIEYEKAALAVADVNKAQNRATLASYLGIDEDRVLELSKQATGANGESNALADMLADKRSNLVRGIAEGLEAEFKDLDSATEGLQSLDLGDVTDFDVLVVSIRSAAANADEATAKRLNDYANALENAKSAAETDFAEAYKQAQDRLKENTYEYKGSTFLQAAAANYSPETNGDFWEYIKSYVGPNGETWNNDWNTAVTGNNGIVAAMSLLSSGGITNGQFSQFITDQMNGAGKNHDYYDLLAQAALGSNYKNGEFVGEGLSEELESMKGNENLAGFYDELISKFPELEDAAKKGGVALKRLNENWKSDKVADVSKYAKGVNGLSDIMNDLAQGGNKARKAEMQLNAEMVNLQDQQTAVNKARGKSGKELQKAKKKGDQTLDMLASLVPYDADQLANMTADELQKVVDEAEPMIADNFTDTIESLFAMLPETDVPINLSDIVKVHADGSVDLNDVANVLTDAEENILQMILSLVGKYADIDVGAILKGDTVTVESFVSALRKAGVKGGGGYSRKSSGGGGGKSAAQAAIDAARHYAAEAQHMTKMAEADLYHPDKMNDFAGYAGAVQANVFTLQQEGQVWRDQIAYLEEQRSKVKEGTDDWWSLTEAINGYTESLAGLEEQIDNINAKLLEEAKEEFGYKITAAQHDVSMSGIDKTYYQRHNDYEGWHETLQQQRSAYEELSRTYYDAIATYQGLQNQEFAANGQSDYWWTLQQEIDSTTESLAELKNTIEELKDEELNINISMRDNALIRPQAESTGLGYEATILGKDNSYGALLANINAQVENNNAQKDIYYAAIEENKALLATLDKDSTTYYSTLQQILDDQNRILELDISNREALAQRIVIIQEAYQTAFDDLTHRENMMNIEQTQLSFSNDYEGYFTSLNNYIVAKHVREDVLTDYINQLRSEQSQWTEGSDEWNELQTAINSVEEEQAQIQSDINELWSKRLSAITEKQEHELSPLTHMANMLSIDESKFSRMNDYDSYVDTIDRENDIRKNMIATQQDQLKELQAEQNLVDKDSDAWWDLQAKIDSVNESIAQNSQEIDNNNKKRLQALQKKHTAEDKPETHAFDMLNLAASRAQLLDNESEWEGVMGDRLAAIRDAISQNDTQVTEAEALLKTYVEGSEEWLSTRDLIWSIKKDTTQKENEALQLEQQIDANRLKEIQKANTRTNASVQHENKQLDVASRIYTAYSNYDNYRTALSGQIDDYQKIRDSAVQARDAALAEMATLEKGTTSWYNARDAVYSYDEAIASATETMLSKQQAIEASRIQEMTQNYADSQLQGNTYLTQLRNQQKIYDSANDYTNYQRVGVLIKEQLEQDLTSKRDYVQGLQNLLKDTTKGTEQWRNLRQTIASELANISNMETEIDSLTRQQTQSKVDHMLEKMDYEDSNRQHNLTLLQYEQTKYQNAGELSNYGIMLEKENQLRNESIDANRKDIAVLKEEQETLEKGSKEYNRITEAIKKKEEAISSDTVAVEKNTKAIEENANAIAETRKKLEDVVEKEIKTREEQRKKQLKSEISLEKTILDTIKQRYKDQWDLEKQDIEKKKEALEKEKSLINERLNARKKAFDTEEKYRELEELQRQLALISNDPTRTRDAKELRQRIGDIEKDISWEKAAEEAESATKRIDEEIQAMNDYVTYHGDNLEEMLHDANNFAQEIANIMSGGWESISEFLIKNNTEFKTSLESVQKDMYDGWLETWKGMNGIVDTYWDQINEVLSSYENFVNFMKESTEYINASETGQQVLQYGWKVLYDNWVATGLIDPNAVNWTSDEHPYEEGSTELTAADILGQNFDWLNFGKEAPSEAMDTSLLTVGDYNNVGLDTKPHAVELTDIQTNDTYTGLGITAAQEETAKEGGESNNTEIKTQEASLTADNINITIPNLTADDAYNTLFNYDYSNVGFDWTPEAPSSYAQVNEKIEPATTNTTKASTTKKSTSSSSTSKTSGSSEKYYDVYDEKGIKTNYTVKASSAEEANQKAKTEIGSYYSSGGTGSTTIPSDTKKAQEKYPNSKLVFKHGGLVDYTGPAWVDGTPTQPEAFLSAYDTEQIGKLAEALRYVYVSPGFIPSSDMFSSNNTYGDINITINQAELNSDADIDDVARRVGKAFTRELSRDGFNLTGYSL